jgi:hypothetical protein
VVPERHEDLIAELRALSDHLDVPAPADQRSAVRRRLTEPRKAPRWRVWLIGVLVAAAAAVGAISPARAAVVSLLRVAGIEVRTTTPGPVPTASPSPLPSEGPVTLAEAQAAARFPVRAPAALGPPDQLVIADPDPSGAPRIVTLIYRGGAVRLDEFDGTLDVVYLKQAPDAQWVDVGPGRDYGLWLPRAHEVTYLGRDGVARTATARLAGPTLIWASGLVTYRLEGVPTMAEALRLTQ